MIDAGKVPEFTVVGATELNFGTGVAPIHFMASPNPHDEANKMAANAKRMTVGTTRFERTVPFASFFMLAGLPKITNSLPQAGG